MNSESDSSFTSFISVQSILKKSRSQISVVWTHCRAAHDNKNLKFKYYIYYTTSPSYYTNISSNMQTHLQRYYQINIKTFMSQVQIVVLK